jgi:hypothetical protein
MGGADAWGALGNIIAAMVGAVALVGAGVVAARATTSAARTSAEAESAVQVALTGRHDEQEALVRALVQSYDRLFVWAEQYGQPPPPTPRVQQFFDTGR